MYIGSQTYSMPEMAALPPDGTGPPTWTTTYLATSQKKKIGIHIHKQYKFYIYTRLHTNTDIYVI